MKKITLITISIFITAFSYGQCVPNTNYTSQGIYPDTVDNLPKATVGLAYSEDITVVTPADTSLQIIGPIPVTVDIDSIVLTAVTGLPSGFDYECDPPSCGFPGGTIKCARLFSISGPVSDPVGNYPITFECIAYADVPLYGGSSVTYVEGGYRLEILPGGISGIYNSEVSSFVIEEAFPNPVDDNFNISFSTKKSTDILFEIYNMLGKLIYQRKVNTLAGSNQIFVNTSEFPEGMYTYFLNDGNSILNRRLLVAR